MVFDTCFSVELFYEYFVVFEKKAGIPGAQLTLAVESESAALYCQSGTHLSGLEPMNPGDKFLLLDGCLSFFFWSAAVFRSTYSDYPFGILKLFLQKLGSMLCACTYCYRLHP
jgi:hypothetical protein